MACDVSNNIKDVMINRPHKRLEKNNNKNQLFVVTLLKGIVFDALCGFNDYAFIHNNTS